MAAFTVALLEHPNCLSSGGVVTGLSLIPVCDVFSTLSFIRQLLILSVNRPGMWKNILKDVRTKFILLEATSRLKDYE